MALILDTSTLFAALNRKDDWHDPCRKLIEEADEPLLIPAAVLPELDYLVSDRLGTGPMIALMRDIEYGAFRVANTSPDSYPQIRELMDRFADSNIGFVDATIAVLANRLEENKIATLDHRHFSLLRTSKGSPFELLPKQ